MHRSGPLSRIGLAAMLIVFPGLALAQTATPVPTALPGLALAQTATPVPTALPDVINPPPPNPAMVNARRDEVVDAVAAASAAGEPPVILPDPCPKLRLSCQLFQYHRERSEPCPRPPAVLERLLTAEYPLAWVVEEIVFRYGPYQLPELVRQVRFMYGQSFKDVVRDAARLGAARRMAERVRNCQALRAADPGAQVVLGLPVEKVETICKWETVDWNLVLLGEAQSDLRFLMPNDDPGGYVSAQ